MNVIRILVFILFIGQFAFISAQNTAAEKARIVFNLAKEITWANENNIIEYKIGVWEEKDSIYNTFLDFKESNELLKSKQIEVIKFQKIDELIDYLKNNQLEIFYLSGKYLKYADTIAVLFDNKACLTVCDNAESVENCVVNLLNREDKYYEINYLEAKNHGLLLTENILVLGGNEQLLREMYLDSMKVLRKERENILFKLYRIQDQETRLGLREQELLEQQKRLDSINSVLEEKNYLIKKQQKILKENISYIAKQKRDISRLKTTYINQLSKIDSIQNELLIKQTELNEKKNKLNSLDKELISSLKQIKSQSDFIKLGIVVFVVLMSVIFILYVRNKEAEKIKEQNRIIKNKNEEILQINDELEEKQHIISEQNKLLSTQIKEITGSINYAKRIQLALLPVKDTLDANFKDNFILYRPKDIVSGDFYWFRKIDDKIIIAVADCTGHGVPGAFMSVLGMTHLSEITNKHYKNAAIVLEILRERLIHSLERETDDVQIKDGIDIALTIIDTKEKKISFAGAYNSMLFFTPKDNQYELTEFKGDLMPVGYYFQSEKYKPFTEKVIEYKQGDRVYMFSDGYKDQFGGKNGRKITKKRFYELLKSVQEKSFVEQKIVLNNFFENWMRNSKLGQIDDVLVVGFELV